MTQATSVHSRDLISLWHPDPEVISHERVNSVWIIWFDGWHWGFGPSSHIHIKFLFFSSFVWRRIFFFSFSRYFFCNETTPSYYDKIAKHFVYTIHSTNHIQSSTTTYHWQHVQWRSPNIMTFIATISTIPTIPIKKQVHHSTMLQCHSSTTVCEPSQKCNSS